MESTAIPEENIPLVIDHIQFATNLARQFYRQRKNLGIELNDFVGAALLGLCYAARCFDAGRGENFRTYAYFRIRGAMYDLLRRSGGVSRSHFGVLVSRKNSYDSIKHEADCKLRSQMPYTFARDSSELIRLRSLIEDVGIRVHPSSERNTVEISYAEEVSPETVAGVSSMRRYIKRLIAELPERERNVIYYRYYERQSFDDMKELFGGMSKSWLSRLHMRALETLKERISEEERCCA